MEENPERENHQALAVKAERHLTCGPESESNPDRKSERGTYFTFIGSNDQRKFTISRSHLFSVNAPLKSVHIDDEEKANIKKIA